MSTHQAPSYEFSYIFIPSQVTNKYSNPQTLAFLDNFLAFLDDFFFLDPFTKKGNLESTPFNQECYEGNSKWIDCDDKKIGSGWRGPPKSWRGC
jgi:hypothetical protein